MMKDKQIKMLDVLDLIKGKETIVRKRIVNFFEKIFNYLGYDFKHDTYKGIVYCEEEYITKVEAKFKMAYDSFMFLVFNRQNQLSTYILNSFFQILLGTKFDEAICLKICNKFYFLYDETPIDKAILFSMYIYEELSEIDNENRLLISLIMFNYCLITNDIPCVQFLGSDIKKYIELIEEYKISKDMQNLYLFIVELFNKQAYQDKTHYINNVNVDIKEVFSELYLNRENIKSKYGIKNIYLYGSFSKTKNRMDSDFDFIVAFNLDLLVEEKEKLKSQFNEYIYSKFHRYSDIHELSNYLTNESLIKNRRIKKIF